MVSGRKPVQEERATAQDNDGQPAGARQQRSLAGSARHADRTLRGWSNYFRYGTRRSAFVLTATPTSVCATSSRDGTKWQGAELAGSLAKLFTEHLAFCVLNACPNVPRRGPAVKPVGEPDTGNRDFRFDERRWETGRWPLAPSYRAHLRLYHSVSDARVSARGSFVGIKRRALEPA